MSKQITFVIQKDKKTTIRNIPFTHLYETTETYLTLCFGNY